ncbi:hypothetical protein, conserved [Eimeria praecox]|uniref:Uncharacterized protein n=1 Tax=Eimeria praecox TaxID=51316 RepID=U6G0K6_9EIME|nr:hypothetical protein, conserved [Eimeria praecox]
MPGRRQRLLLLLAAAAAAALLLLSIQVEGSAAADNSTPSRFKEAENEEAALAQLKQLQQQQQQQNQQQQQQQQQNQQQQQQQEQELQDAAEFALRRGWFKLAQEIILYSHVVGVDVAYRVRRVVMEIRNSLSEMERLLNKKHDEVAVYVQQQQQQQQQQQ